MASLKYYNKTTNQWEYISFGSGSGSSDILIDSTLTKAGQAADAKAVGDALSKLSGGNTGNGENGFSPIAKVEQTENGAVISITDKSGTTTATVINGKDGYTPVPGTDYYTEEDKIQFETYITMELAKRGQLKPEFANSIEECTDITKLYVLPDGYIYAYMKYYKNNNQIVNSINSDGSAYNEGKGWKTRYRLNSSGVEVEFSDWEVTGFMPVTIRSKAYITNINFNGDEQGKDYLSLYDSNFNCIASATLTSWYDMIEASSASDAYKELYSRDDNGNFTFLDFSAFKMGGFSGIGNNNSLFDNTAYFRLSAYEITDNSIITIDGEITEDDELDTYAWINTGHAFISRENIEGNIDINVDANYEFINSIDDCIDINKLYIMPDGYIYAYMRTEGALAFTNQLDNAIDTDGTKYNGGLGYKEGWRFNSSHAEVEAEGQLITGYIPYIVGQIIRISGFSTSDTPNGYFQTCKSDFSINGNNQMQQIYGTDPGFTYEPDPTAEGVYMLTIDPAKVTHGTFKYTLVQENQGTAYIRINISEYNASELKVTLDEEISYGGTTSKWMNTGHAFIPTDYEDRIIELEETVETNSAELATQKAQIAALAGKKDTSIPDYVIAEAESVIDRVAAAQNGRTFTFAALADMHYGAHSYWNGVNHACQALKYINERIELDAVAVLGDYTDGWPDEKYDDAIADFKTVNSILDDLRFAPNLRLAGNHDIYNENPALTMRYINAYSDDVVWGSRSGGYFYRDFDAYKIRVIGLNTSMVTTEQYSWFVSALDLTDKEDVSQWSILVISHHPLDWYPEDEIYRFCYILDGYRNGTSGDANGIAYDFTGGKNAAKLIGNIHGHLHNFKVDKIYIGNVNSGEQSDVLRIATPNSCYNRENEYENAWAEDTAYHKIKDSAKDTSFCVYCINLDAGTIKAICYGAGYDREVSYQYDNDVTPPTAEPEKVSWNDLTDKPFGEEMADVKVETLTKEFGQAEVDYYWKFSDDVPTMDDFANGAVVTMFNPETGKTTTIEYTSFYINEQDDCIHLIEVDYMFEVFVAPFDGAMANGTIFPTSGIYMANGWPGEVGYTVTLNIPGYEFTTQGTTIKQLDEKYIPDTIARKSDIPEQTVEEWIFELADGTTVTKQVVVV